MDYGFGKQNLRKEIGYILRLFFYIIFTLIL